MGLSAFFEMEILPQPLHQNDAYARLGPRYLVAGFFGLA
jgi:hypothetical protein